MKSAGEVLRVFLASKVGQRFKGLGIRAFGRLGYQMVQLELAGQLDLVNALRCRGVETVVDVGANQGQFGSRLRMMGWRGPILSLEPEPSAFQLLQSVARRKPPWTTMQVAASSAPGLATLNVSRNSVSSSLLLPADAHLDAAPLSEPIGTTDVAVLPLDDIIAQHGCRSPLFIKIDTQGSELEVLRGAPKALSECRLVQVELSLRPMYHGQPDWLEVVTFLCRNDFSAIHLEPALVHPLTLEVLQVDILMSRTQLGAS